MRKLSFSLWQYAAVFQAEIYVIMACIMGNMNINYNNRNINSQAALGAALDSFQMKLKLVWDCLESFIKLEAHNRVNWYVYQDTRK
jgi:hypothetical protein